MTTLNTAPDLAPTDPALPASPVGSDGKTVYHHFIDGAFVDPVGRDWFDSIDPVTGAAWARIPRGTAEDVDAAVLAARRAFRTGPWPAMKPFERGRLLLRLAELIRDNADWLARVEMKDNGRLISELSRQMRYMARYYEYYGGMADKIEGTVIPTDKADVFNYTRYEPLGVVACIMPWNAPLPLTSKKLAPALAAGNTVVLKPSEFTSASLLEFVKLVEAAGFPPGVVNVVTGTGQDVGVPLVDHPLVERIAFTGGPEAGRAIAERAAGRMKRVTMELGGKSPNVVFADANLDQAVKGAVAGIFAASGQSCVAGSRLLLQDEIHDDFVARLIDLVKDARYGHPADPQTQITPISTAPQRDKIEHYVAVAQGEGATLALGGGRPRVPDYPGGLFFEPTIFTGVDNAMRIAQEEVFGPVLSVLRFTDEDDAVDIANDIPYGLAAGVWTRSIPRAVRMAERLRAGTVWINNYRSTSVTSPFGGFGQSGLGREGGIAGLMEYLEIKSVWISTSDVIDDPYVRR